MKNSEKNSIRNFALRRDWFLIFILIAFSTYLFIFKLGGPSLWETDELIYGEVAKEILKSGDWITLHFNYREWFDKPPLYMWLTAFFYRFFGWNEFTTRIWSSFFGIAQVMVIYFFGKILFNKRVGFISAIILATSLQFIVQSRLALVDVPLSFFISLSILFFYLGCMNPDKSWHYLLSSFFMALATLTKGPVGIIIPVLIIGIYLLLTKSLGQLKRMKLLQVAIVFFLVASPWYIIELMRHGWTFIDNFFLLRTVSRFTTSFEGHTGPVYYYISVLFAGFFPWSSFLPFSFFHLLRKGKRGEVVERKKSFLILVWFAVIFVFFSAAKSKLPGYIFPLYPVCALSVGKLWDEFIVSKTIIGKKALFASFTIFFTLLVVLTLAVVLVAKASFPLEYSLSGKVVILTIAGLFISGIFSFIFLIFKKNAFASLAGLVGGMCFLVWVLTIYILPLTETFKPTKFLAKQIKSVIQPGEKIGNYPASDENFMSFDCSLIYYSDHPVTGIDSRENLKVFLTSKERVYCVMSKKDYQEVEKQLYDVPVYVLDKKGGKVLLSNKQK